MQDALTTAIEMHRTGQLGPAAQWYQKALVGEEENADALHLLGVLHHQQGDHARAVELIGRAVALRPNAFAFHANLAEAYRAQGKFDRAIGCCRAGVGPVPGLSRGTVQPRRRHSRDRTGTAKRSSTFAERSS